MRKITVSDIWTLHESSMMFHFFHKLIIFHFFHLPSSLHKYILGTNSGKEWKGNNRYRMSGYISHPAHKKGKYKHHWWCNVWRLLLALFIVFLQDMMSIRTKRGDMDTLLSSDWSSQASDWLTRCLMFAISRNISLSSDPSDTAPARSSALWP